MNNEIEKRIKLLNSANSKTTLLAILAGLGLIGAAVNLGMFIMDAKDSVLDRYYNIGPITIPGIGITLNEAYLSIGVAAIMVLLALIILVSLLSAKADMKRNYIPGTGIFWFLILASILAVVFLFRIIQSIIKGAGILQNFSPSPVDLGVMLLSVITLVLSAMIISQVNRAAKYPDYVPTPRRRQPSYDDFSDDENGATRVIDKSELVDTPDDSEFMDINKIDGKPEVRMEDAPAAEEVKENEDFIEEAILLPQNEKAEDNSNLKAEYSLDELNAAAGIKAEEEVGTTEEDLLSAVSPVEAPEVSEEELLKEEPAVEDKPEFIETEPVEEVQPLAEEAEEAAEPVAPVAPVVPEVTEASEKPSDEIIVETAENVTETVTERKTVRKVIELPGEDKAILITREFVDGKLVSEDTKIVDSSELR